MAGSHAAHHHAHSQPDGKRQLAAKVLTVSDGVIAGTREDRSGEALSEALAAAGYEVVERRVVACVQVSGPVRSSYRWEGKMQREEEYMLTAKTLAGRYEQVAAFLRETHPYDLPEIIAVAVHAADGAYLNWAKEQCTS